MRKMEREKNQRPIDKIFNGFLMGPKIFKDRDVVQATYVPEDLPHRESQITRIGGILATILKGGVPSNIFLYGKTGTGKTAVVLYVLKRLVAKCEEIKIRVPLKDVVNCRDTDTDYRIFARLASTVGKEVPFTGLPTDEVFSRFKVKLDSERRTLIVVLDEIDQLVKKVSIKRTPNRVLYELTRINSDLRKARVCIIGISNDLKFKDYLDPRVLSSLSEEEMVFPPYKATELLDILKQRAEIGFNPGVITDGTIEITSALAAREHGDARRAIDLLRVAGELAERESDEQVTESHVRRAQTLIESNTVSDALKTLPSQSKVVLYSIYRLAKDGITDITSGNLYATYAELCGVSQFDKLTPRRVSDLVNELKMMGIITASTISQGRYGRTKKVKLNISKSLITSVLEEDYIIQKLRDLPLEHGKKVET